MYQVTRNDSAVNLVLIFVQAHRRPEGSPQFAASSGPLANKSAPAIPAAQAV